MRVLVFGAGAVGSILAARFVLAGEDVLAIGRAEHVEAIRAEGLRVEGLAGTPVRIPAAAELSPSTPAELVVLTVKTFDLGPAGLALARSLARPTPVLALENGLGVERELSEALGTGCW